MKKQNEGRAEVFVNGRWEVVMGHPIFGDAFHKSVFREAVKQARKAGKPQPYNNHYIRVVG